jgi:hypothetical protein
MEVDGNKLIFQPRQHRQHFGILKVIDQGLTLRAQETETTTEEQAFARRIQRVIRDLDFGEWKKDQVFAINSPEALTAVEAIDANTGHELAENHGGPYSELHDINSIMAHHARTEIREFAELHP